MQIKPFGDQILIKPIVKKQILVGEAAPMCEYGTVIAIGSQVEHVKVGDTLGFTVWGINSLQIDNEKYYFIQEDPKFILGKIELSQ